MRNTSKLTFAHKPGKPRFLNTPSFTGCEYQHDQPNGAAFKTIQSLRRSVTQACYFTQLFHFSLVFPMTQKYRWWCPLSAETYWAEVEIPINIVTFIHAIWVSKMNSYGQKKLTASSENGNEFSGPIEEGKFSIIWVTLDLQKDSLHHGV
jgi:hypothetical protein